MDLGVVLAAPERTTGRHGRVPAAGHGAAAAGRGRGPLRIPVTVFGAPPDKGLLAEFAAAGADCCLLALAHLDASQTLATLDDWARLSPA
jgi:hypothetical protein